MNTIEKKPFLKWAGGKTQLLPELQKYVPIKYNKYIEPFVGGGALFFCLNSRVSILADTNEELIITYTEIRDNVDGVISILKTFEHNEEFYYNIRSLNPEKSDKDFRAARLIYLNKTCYNGLYRVNKKGQFNVPYGKGNGKFLQEHTLRNASVKLKNTDIIFSDYLKILKEFAEPNDFVFLDPPYFPVSQYSDFKRYTKEIFYKEDQILLQTEFSRLVDLGCNVILTNSNHPFILELYKDYKIELFKTKRLISSDSSSRYGYDIIVIGSYDK